MTDEGMVPAVAVLTEDGDAWVLELLTFPAGEVVAHLADGPIRAEGRWGPTVDEQQRLVDDWASRTGHEATYWRANVELEGEVLHVTISRQDDDHDH